MTLLGLGGAGVPELPTSTSDAEPAKDESLEEASIPEEDVGESNEREKGVELFVYEESYRDWSWSDSSRAASESESHPGIVPLRWSEKHTDLLFTALHQVSCSPSSLSSFSSSSSVYSTTSLRPSRYGNLHSVKVLGRKTQ